MLRMSEAPTPEIPEDVPWIGTFVKSPEDMQVLKLLIAANELGRPFVASREVPAEQLETLRKAFDATMRDKNYLALAAKRHAERQPRERAGGAGHHRANLQCAEVGRRPRQGDRQIALRLPLTVSTQ